MKKIGLIFIGILSLVSALTGYFYLKGTAKKNHHLQKEQLALEKWDYQRAISLIESKDFREASSLIKKYRPTMERQDQTGSEWLNLFIRLSTETSNLRQLEAIYEFHPAAFFNHEQASLMLAESWLNRGKKQELVQLRQGWMGQEKKQSEWQLLDAEALILAGERSQAIELLESQHFEGSVDTPRLTQLALLHLSQDPQKAWGYLEIANDKEPNNPSILTYRAKLLESIGQHDWALKEYAAAAEADRENLARRDQLIDFHLRHEELEIAMETLQDSLTHPELTENLAVKAFFLNRMVRPFEIDWKNISFTGKNFPLYNYLVDLAPPTFWNESTFRRLANHQKYEERSQAIWWLRLLSTLQQNSDEAAIIINNNPFSHLSWNPNLELAFKRILHYRMHGTLYLDDEQLPTEEVIVTIRDKDHEKMPNFFEELDLIASRQQSNPNFKMPEEFDILLHSNEAYVAALTAAGWNEAAIDMHYSKPTTANTPEWVNHQFGQILQINRGLNAVEQRARQAHYAGDIKLAQTLYNTIIDQSTEAKSYLARQAFVDKQWIIARELTIQLLKEHPGNKQLWDNLSKIEAMLTKNKQ